MDRTLAPGIARSFPRKSEGVSRRDGGAWPLRQAVSAMRNAHPADPLRVQRNQLLSGLPDRREAFGRPRSLAPASRGLAAHAGRTGSAQAALNAFVYTSRSKPTAFPAKRLPAGVNHR